MWCWCTLTWASTHSTYSKCFLSKGQQLLSKSFFKRPQIFRWSILTPCIFSPRNLCSWDLRHGCVVWLSCSLSSRFALKTQNIHHIPTSAVKMINPPQASDVENSIKGLITHPFPCFAWERDEAEHYTQRRLKWSWNFPQLSLRKNWKDVRLVLGKKRFWWYSENGMRVKSAWGSSDMIHRLDTTTSLKQL